MTPLKLSQAFLSDLVLLAYGVPVLSIEDAMARARLLTRELADHQEPAVVEAREFLEGIGAGVLAIEEYGARARELFVALEPVAWPAVTS